MEFAALLCMEMNSDKRLLWPEGLKIIAVFAVILIHSAAPLLIAYQRLGEIAWWIGNLYDSLARWCIPVFVMLSGTFVIDKAKGADLGRFLRRRGRRVVVPLLAWSAIYFLWRIHANHEELTFGDFFSLLLQEPAYYHLWFLYMLIGLYVLAPVVNTYMTNASPRGLLYLVGLWGIFGSVIPMLESHFGFVLYPLAGPADSVLRYLGYFVLGRMLRDVTPGSGWRMPLTGVFLLGYSVTALGTYYLTVVRGAGIFNGLFYEYYSLNVLAMAVSILLVAKSFGLKAASIQARASGGGILGGVAACVPGIYLVHAMVIAILKRGMAGFAFSQTTFHPALGVPAFSFAVFGISLAFAFVIRRVPVLRWIVP